MGILDNVLNSVKSDLEHKAGRGISDTVSKGVDGAIKKGGNSCPKCKKGVPDPRPKFCPDCGAPLIIACKKCKSEYPVGTAFCQSCGSKL